jgi:hypothetical protein
MAEVNVAGSFKELPIIPLHPALVDADDHRGAFDAKRPPCLSLGVGIPGDRVHLDWEFLLDVGLGHGWLSSDHQCSVREKPLDE